MKGDYFMCNRSISLLLVCAMIAGGCGVQQQWEAPKSSFDDASDLNGLIALLKKDAAIPTDPNTVTEDSRNRFVNARVAITNIDYYKYVSQLTRDKKLLDASTDILVLSLNIAGAAFTPAGTKTALAALSAGATGSKAIVDKTFFFEKTIPALIAQMNAQRKLIWVRMLKRMNEPLSTYSFAQAYDDYVEFKAAGTLTEAVNGLELQAATQANEAKEELQNLQLLPPEVRDLKRKLTSAIGTLKQDDLPKIQAALTALQVPNPPAQFPAARDLLQKQVREARDPDRVNTVSDAFQKAQISF